MLWGISYGRGLAIWVLLGTGVTSWHLVLSYLPIYIVEPLDHIYSLISLANGSTYRNARLMFFLQITDNGHTLPVTLSTKQITPYFASMSCYLGCLERFQGKV